MARPNLRNPLHLIAAGFGSGLAPRAPGTFGTLAALPLWGVLQLLPLPLYAIVVAAAFALGVYACGRTAHDMRVHDHGTLVWDEFVGIWIALAMSPLTWQWIAAGFVVFRLLDIWKPWPISWCDRNLQGGMGVMVDDAVAGAATLILLQTAAALLS